MGSHEVELSFLFSFERLIIFVSIPLVGTTHDVIEHRLVGPFSVKAFATSTLKHGLGLFDVLVSFPLFGLLVLKHH